MQKTSLSDVWVATLGDPSAPGVSRSENLCRPVGISCKIMSIPSFVDLQQLISKFRIFDNPIVTSKLRVLHHSQIQEYGVYSIFVVRDFAVTSNLRHRKSSSFEVSFLGP